MGTRILELADHLQARGVDVSALRPLQAELDVVQHPRGVRSLSDKAVAAAKVQWSHVVGEWQESRTLFALLRKRVAQRRPLAPDEADEVRAQLADLLRMVPAGLIAATNGTLPLPGTSLLTPVLLSKLKLLPSRWREAHVLGELQRQAEQLRAAGRVDEALQVEALQHRLEDEADARAHAATRAWLLAHWDADDSGYLDDDELAAYEAEVARLVERVRTDGSRKRWFVSYHGQVLGPLRVADLHDLDTTDDLLLCYDGRSGWVELHRVLG
jgi:hypothetical protein